MERRTVMDTSTASSRSLSYAVLTGNPETLATEHCWKLVLNAFGPTAF